MTQDFPALSTERADAVLLARLRRVEGVCVTVAGAVAMAAVMRNLAPRSQKLLGWADLSLPMACAALASAVSLGFMLRRRVRHWQLFRSGFAIAAAIFASRCVAIQAYQGVAASARGMSWLVVIAFWVLAIALVVLPINAGMAGFVPDAALFGLGWIVVGLVMGEALGLLHAFGVFVPPQIPHATLTVLLLLTFVVFAQRAEHGHFSIFVSRGIGGRTARILLPVVLLLPSLREFARSQVVLLGWLPKHYAAGILASLGTTIALFLVMIVARQLRRLEEEVEDLSLRDELTGLYNLRGFQILAEQALRMAHRSQVPFSILYVDVDNLKVINDREGHGTGSRLLVEAAEFLTSHFRETDIVARIGGDEFAVAGHFTPEAIEQAEYRLQIESVSEKRSARLSLSMGHASSDPRRPEPLQSLLERADSEMYRRKREKKLLAV